MNKVELTIIIPVYNVESYLRECLDSLLNISYLNKKLEVILVDDGSIDNSYEICKEYSAKYSFIRIIKQENLGQSAARNVAINKANGKWISFIDSDDIVTRDYLSILFTIIDNCIDSVDMVMFKYQSFNGNNLSSKQIKRKFDQNKFKEIDKNLSMYLLTEINYWGNYLWNKIFKKQILMDNLLPEGKKYEDIGTLYKYVFEAKKIYVYDDVLYYYRQREGSTVHVLDMATGIDEIEARKNQLVFFKKYHYMAAFQKAERYFIESCLRQIFYFPNTKLYSLSLNYIKKYNPNLKKDGLYFWLKVKIAKYSPGTWRFLRKIKDRF